ncbi:alpha/beta hydrolase fold domain-containing protein [Erythrobacter sp. WG]|uniref:alpha/beta hydrolase fold domain-containing protein n=1 Tax=Erythrobacter sp. WG TaxID=2985510 RepID=UPI00226D9911|nr:alpha/beta hydrolase fold domain-containing protein [Erythrobacter sp. WG]MCX9146001.1 alpha/beta hydrolase [Erythrobacter sp. WG]
MLTDTAIVLRSASPSLLMRAVKWLIGRRPPVFPADEAGFHAVMAGRKLPLDAPMPETFRKKFRIEEREVLGHKVVTLHPLLGPGAWRMLYFHGGGFVRPMFKEHWPLVAEMVKQCRISVTVPLYPVVPEASASDQDALADAVYAELAASHDPARIILNGDSAGGHMALALALRLVKAGGPLPGKLALFAPWLDLGLADPAIAAIEPFDLMLKIGTLRACGKLVAAGRAIDDPAVSPLYARAEDLAQLPPTRIWTGRHDLFIIDSRSFVRRLRAAGVDAKFYEYEAAPHVFMAITPTREAKDTIGLLKEFLRE